MLAEKGEFPRKCNRKYTILLPLINVPCVDNQ